MLLERIYDEDLAQTSYLIGCQAEGVASVVDARRDIEVYQRLATAQDMTIVAVTETHIHADYLSGTRELAAATGATIYRQVRARKHHSPCRTHPGALVLSHHRWCLE